MFKHVLRNLISSPWEERLPVLFKGSLSWCEMPWSLLLSLSLRRQVCSCMGVGHLPSTWRSKSWATPGAARSVQGAGITKSLWNPAKGFNSCLDCNVGFFNGVRLCRPHYFSDFPLETQLYLQQPVIPGRVRRSDRTVECCKPGVSYCWVSVQNIDPYAIVGVKCRQQFLSIG